jgi:Zn finger protein HypA/HybF involved in hydrogenase expression
MFRAQKEIIWHLSCQNCGFYWTMPTMEEKLQIEKNKYSCPICQKSGHAKEVKNPS